MVLIKTQRDTLLAPLQSVSGIVERRHTLPILSNVLLEKKGDRLTLLATDIEIQITTTTQGAGGDDVERRVHGRHLHRQADHEVRERDAELAATREQALRDERVMAMGTLAAGAAHELGTPLGTMALLAGEHVGFHHAHRHETRRHDQQDGQHAPAEIGRAHV